MDRPRGEGASARVALGRAVEVFGSEATSEELQLITRFRDLFFADGGMQQVGSAWPAFEAWSNVDAALALLDAATRPAAPATTPTEPATTSAESVQTTSTAPTTTISPAGALDAVYSALHAIRDRASAEGFFASIVAADAMISDIDRQLLGGRNISSLDTAGMLGDVYNLGYRASLIESLLTSDPWGSFYNSLSESCQ